MKEGESRVHPCNHFIDPCIFWKVKLIAKSFTRLHTLV